MTVNINIEDPSRSFLLAEEASLITLAFAGGAGILGVLVGGAVVGKGLTGDAE